MCSAPAVGRCVGALMIVASVAAASTCYACECCYLPSAMWSAADITNDIVHSLKLDHARQPHASRGCAMFMTPFPGSFQSVLHHKQNIACRGRLSTSQQYTSLQPQLPARTCAALYCTTQPAGVCRWTQLQPLRQSRALCLTPQVTAWLWATLLLAALMCPVLSPLYACMAIQSLTCMQLQQGNHRMRCQLLSGSAPQVATCGKPASLYLSNHLGMTLPVSICAISQSAGPCLPREPSAGIAFFFPFFQIHTVSYWPAAASDCWWKRCMLQACTRAECCPRRQMKMAACAS